jgi:hypothetical protein
VNAWVSQAQNAALRHPVPGYPVILPGSVSFSWQINRVSLAPCAWETLVLGVSGGQSTYISSPVFNDASSPAYHSHKHNLLNAGGSITITIGTICNRPVHGWCLSSDVAEATDSATRGRIDSSQVSAASFASEFKFTHGGVYRFIIRQCMHS